MSRIAFSGGCQCGAVRYHATETRDDSHICHCRMCQKAVGNMFASLIGVPRAALTWTRGTPARFRSSAHVDRGFCARCGTPLFYENVTGNSVTLTIGSADHPELFPPLTQDSIEGKLPYFDELHALTSLGPTGSGGSEAWAEANRLSNNQHPDYDTAEWPAAQGASR